MVINTHKKLLHLFSITAITLVVISLSLPTLYYGYLLEDYKFIRSYSAQEVVASFYLHWEPSLMETKGYRPFHSIHYAFFHLLIGGDPLKNHILQIVIFISLSLLLYLFTFHFTNNISAAFWSAIIYLCLSTSAWQMSWLNHRHQLLQVIFFLLFLLFYDQFLRKGAIRAWIICLIFFILALLIKETAIVFPLIALFMAIFFRKEGIYSQIKPLLPFLVIIGLYLVIRSIIITGMSPENLAPPPIQFAPGKLIFEYCRSIFATIIQSQGVREINAYPLFSSGITTTRDLIGLFSAAGFFCLASMLLFLNGSNQLKKTLVLALVILLITNVMVSFWYRTNRFFLSSIGVAIISGILISEIFRIISGNSRSYLKRLAIIGLLFFVIFLGVNIQTFLEIQWVLQPKGELSLIWDKKAYEYYIPWMKKEQILILEEKLCRTGRSEWADELEQRIEINNEP